MDRINRQKSIRETSSCNPSRKKSFTQQSIERSAKATEQQRQQTKPEAAHRSTSSIKDIQVKLDNLYVSGSRDSNLQIYKTLRDQPRQAHRSASTSRQSEAHLAKQVRRPKQGSSSFSHLAQNSFNAGRSKKLALAGGGDPDDSSSKQQEKTTKQREATNESKDQYERNIPHSAV